jgi:hypothetical protein
MGAMWHFNGYQDYPASIPTVCSFKVQTPEQLDFFVRSGKISGLQLYYNRPTELENFKYVDFLKTIIYHQLYQGFIKTTQMIVEIMCKMRDIISRSTSMTMMVSTPIFLYPSIVLISSNNNIWPLFRMHQLHINMHLAQTSAALLSGGQQYADMLIKVSQNQDSTWCQEVERIDENTATL